jgi:hypothetical protein
MLNLHIFFFFQFQTNDNNDKMNTARYYIFYRHTYATQIVC